MSVNQTKNYGLAAVGSAGRFDVDVDENFEDPCDIQLAIRTPMWQFRFKLSERGTVEQIHSFLRLKTGALEFSELIAGTFHNAPVRFIKDDEFGDRFFLRAHGQGQLVDFVLAGNEIKEFTEAIKQAVQNLET